MKMNSPFRAKPFRANLALTLFAVLFVAGCSKKPPIPPPPPPPASSGGGPVNNNSSGRPVVAEFTAEPAGIQVGQSALLRWSVTGANDISIDHGIGTVQSTGTSRVSPSVTTTYTLTANGTGGATSGTATVRIVSPPPPPPPVVSDTGNRSKGTVESRTAELQDALFDYDSNNIRDDARAALTSDADAIKRILIDFPSASINVEGHCDERGSAEYNLGLGDRRATSTKEFLVQLGVPGDKIRTVSYGKERPQCTEASEDCYAKNRRAHITAAP